MVEKLGGRKFLLALVIVLVILAVLLVSAVRGQLDTGLAGVLVGAVTWVATQFGLTNSAITKAAIAAEEAKNAEARRLAGMSDSDVLAAAGAGAAVQSAVDGATVAVRGAVDAVRADGASGADAARARVARAADDSRERLRRAATAGGGGFGS